MSSGHNLISIILTSVASVVIPFDLLAQNLPAPTYPCHVETITFPQTAPAGSEQTVAIQISYDISQTITIVASLSDPSTRSLIDSESFLASGIGEQSSTLQFTTLTVTGAMQLIYEVNYYSETLQQNVSCENGADFITTEVTAATTEPATTNTTDTTTPTSDNSDPTVTTQSAADNAIFFTPGQSNQTLSDETDEPGPSPTWPMVGVVLGGSSMIGVGYWWVRHKTKPQPKPKDIAVPIPPVQPKKPITGPKETYVCSCTVTISGPDELPLCTCWHSPMTLSAATGDGAKAFLDIDDLQKKCTHTFKATCTPNCAGAPRNLKHTWSLLSAPQANQPLPATIELGCTAAFDATLPDGTETRVTCTTSKSIKIVQHSCAVYIIYVAGAANDTSYGHVAMQITCGPNSIIYGYYSANNSLSGPGQVLSHDDAGKNYENFYPDYERLVFDIKTINGGKKLNCRQCARLVNFWKFLAQDPGLYGTNNTCTTRLADALEAIGLVDLKNFKKSFWGPVVGTNDMAIAYPSQFINVLFQGIAPKAVYPPQSTNK